jgi:integrase
LAVLADTGMRIEELVNLKVSDIDEQAGVICIASEGLRIDNTVSL